MKGKALLIIFICTTIVVLLFIFSKEQTELVGPNFSRIQSQNISPQPSPAPPKAPKTFQFDSSTNLKEELEKVNPQVLDSDFEGL